MLENKVHIGNSRFSIVGFEEVLQIMTDEIEKKQGKYYTAITNLHVMVLVARDPELARIINNADVCFCDSFSIVKLGKREGKIIPRCYGPDYVLKCCGFGLKYGWRHYFLGGEEGVADMMAIKLRQQFSGIQIAGTYCPPFRKMSKVEIDEMILSINKTRPDIVWVGLGAGKQDKWIADFKNRINATWFSGVGAAFDFISGNKKRAPFLWREIGFEWLYRFAFEPRRLFIRYLGGTSLFLKFCCRSIKGRMIEFNHK